MSEIFVAGEAFNVLLEGDASKEVLVVAHQLGGSLAVWDGLAPALLEHFRILRYDSRGHGSSVATREPYSITGLARDAIGILDAFGVEKAHWLGLSMGAIVGQAALILAPRRIGRAVLANTAAQLGPPDLWNARIQMVLANGVASLVESTAERWFTPEFRAAQPETVAEVMNIFRNTSAEGYASACAALRDADQREAIRSIKNKALVMVGRSDPSAPPSLGAFVASAIEGAKLVTLEASHISHIEDREAFIEATIDFLTSAESPARTAPLPRKRPARLNPARQALAARIPEKKAAPNRAPAKKAAAKKAVGKKAPPKKVPPKKAAARKPVSKTAAIKTALPKKAAAKQAAIKKIAAKPAAKSRAIGKSSTASARTKTAAKKRPRKGKT
jgi:3-oxoadipate enol-lactonase